MKIALSLLALLFSQSLLLAQRIDRIEPANWWVGMQYNTITLLVYGDHISGLQPRIAYPKVKLEKTETVENENYLFVTLTIHPAAKPGDVKIDFLQNNKVVLTENFPLLKREENSAQRPSFTPKDAIFLIVPDRFANGDSGNDVVAALYEKELDRKGLDKRHGGDIQGIIDHLDYVQSLGFTQIWNTPLTENNQPKYSYHGYATTDFYKIDPRFGTNELFKEMVDQAKKRGIGLIWDVVLNHCGAQYYFIKDLPAKDWVNFTDSRTLTNHLKSTINDRYAAEIDKLEYTDGWFDGQMADLNQRNPLVARFLIQNTLWWIEYAGLSGLREDTFSYSDKEFLAEWTKAILDEYPNMNITGEEMSRIVAQTSYWQIDKINADGYQCYLPTLMDFLLNDNIVSSLNGPDGWFSTWRVTYQGIAEDYQYPHPENQLIFPDNHDLDRFYSRLNKDYNHWKLGMAMYMTMRGIPQFFYGTEVLMTNDLAGNDGQRRTDFYGGWENDAKNAFTGQGLSEAERAAQAYFSKLLNWRKTSQAIATGKFMHFAPQKNDVYVYFRYTSQQKVMVILNKNKEAVTFDIQRYAQMVPGTFKATDIVSGAQISVENTLTVPAVTAMILEINE